LSRSILEKFLTDHANSVIREVVIESSHNFKEIRNVKTCMTFQKLAPPFLFILILLLFFLTPIRKVPGVLAASSRLPDVAPEMERPEFWIKKIKDPMNLFLTPEKIRKMNEENLGRQDLHLCRIKDLKEDWTREEIFSLLKSDWEDFGKTAEARYGKNGMPLGESFWNEIKNKLDRESIGESSRMLYALVVKGTDIRVFPTDEPSVSTPGRYEFDRFQHSSISPGSPVGIYHFSKDKEWAYGQTPFIRGWVRTNDLAIANERTEVVNYEESMDRLTVTGNFIHVFCDPSLRERGFLAQMGDTFPLLSIPGSTQTTNACYVILIPSRGDNGKLTFQKGYIRADDDVHRGFLSYTQEIVARQAFKMLNHPYGWGDRLGGRDCSRFLMDLFRIFGILMPRNSSEQARVGMDLGRVKGMTEKGKQKVLDQAIPLVTTLRIPGHIMLYLGKNKGRYYVIHSIWGIQRHGTAGSDVEKIGKVVVSDLGLGRSGPDGSLLHRLEDVRLIGEER
jgi:hypothetical protein